MAVGSKNRDDSREIVIEIQISVCRQSERERDLSKKDKCVCVFSHTRREVYNCSRVCIYREIGERERG